MIIRFCVSLGARPPSAYGKLRNTNILVLRNRGTLRDYKNAIRPRAGFNKPVTDEVIKIASPLKGYERCVVVYFDKIKIQENLVFGLQYVSRCK